MCAEGAQVQLQCERCVPKVLKLSSEVSECNPPRVEHSFPSLLNYLSVLEGLDILSLLVGPDVS
jgi:hypothetical protein